MNIFNLIKNEDKYKEVLKILSSKVDADSKTNEKWGTKKAEKYFQDICDTLDSEFDDPLFTASGTKIFLSENPGICIDLFLLRIARERQVSLFE